MQRLIVPALLVAAMAARAQTPAPRAAPAPRPVMPAPVVAPVLPDAPFDVDVQVDVDAMRANAEAIRAQAREMAADARSQAREIAEAARVQALDALDLRLDGPDFADLRVNTNIAMDMARASVDRAMIAMPTLAFSSDRLMAARPPAPWAQGDPADSLYRMGREAMNRGDYRHAAQLFAELTQKYPKSAYAPTAAYYEAFARYRIGTTDELRSATRVLEALNTRQADFAHRGDIDVAALAARINGTLAQRGDRDAAAKIARQANQAGTGACDRDDVAVRVEALSALDRMDRAEALPLIKRVLQHKDECSTELRRRAVFMLVRDKTDSSAYPILVDVAKTDPSPDVRSDAVLWLSRLPTDAAVTALDALTRDSDERIQRAAIRALTMSDSQRAKQSVRTLIEREDAPLPLRLEAISSLVRGDRGTAEDAAYLRALYSKVDKNAMKDVIISTVSRIDDPANAAWILSIARNTNESDDIRATALGRLGRMSVPIGDLVKLYDLADTRTMREQLISVYSVRKEPEATDKLIDVARSGTDPAARRMAINALSRKNDPRTTKLLLELVEKP